MLGDNKIDSLDTHLEQFKLVDQTRQRDLQVPAILPPWLAYAIPNTCQNLLKEYSQLLVDYRGLRNTLEDERTRKQAVNVRVPAPAAPNLGRSSYVLVLVDANDYVFNDELIRAKEDGGVLAARLLSQAVELYLQREFPAAARATNVVMRVYADLTSLSKNLAKEGAVGFDKRSLAPFSSAFSSKIGLCDWVDTLDAEGTRAKIKGMWALRGGLRSE